MAINTQKAFSTPRSMYGKPVDDVLLRACGISPGQGDVGLAHVVVTAAIVGSSWHVYLVDPSNPPSASEDALGYFTEDSLVLSPRGVLSATDKWLRESSSVEWMPGPVIPGDDCSNPANALGHVLVRASDTQL